MPADFSDTPIPAPLGRLRTITRGATTFASDVMAVLTAAFGPSNPFGTAATRNTGTVAGDVPLLNSDARIEPSLIPEATTTARGGVMLANAVTDARDGVVPTAAQITAYAAGVATGLSAENFTITELTSGTVFTPPGIGLIVIGAAGGGGHRPPASRRNYLNDGQGNNAAHSYLYYGSNPSTDSANTRIEVRGGFGGARAGNTARPGNSGVTILSPPQGTGRPAFSMVLAMKGAQGGVAGEYSEGTAQTQYAGVPGGDGELLLARVSNNQRYRVVLGAPGTGGAALTGLSSGVRSVAGGNGTNAFALFVRLA